MKTLMFALIGFPLGHSMSPFIHARLFRLAKKTAEYRLIEIPPEELDQKICELKKLDGFNVTIPHKQAVIPFLDQTDDLAALYGAVNTVACADRTAGYNTDAPGFKAALDSAGITPGGRVVLCGAGGAARMMAFEIASRNDCTLTIAVRGEDAEQAEKLKNEILDKIGCAAETALLSDLSGGIDLLLNATPVGMHPYSGVMPVSGEVLKNTHAVFDAVYNPKDTLLLKTAESFGAKICGGMPMLVWQAVFAHKIWYGGEFAQEDIETLISDTQAQMERQFKG